MGSSNVVGQVANIDINALRRAACEKLSDEANLSRTLLRGGSPLPHSSTA